MENDITTPEQTTALRGNQKQRLKDLAEALLKAVEALEPPKTYAEADRAAKTLISINKALDQIHGPAPETPQAPRNLGNEHADDSPELKRVYANTYRRLAKIDIRMGRDSEFTRLADRLEEELAGIPNRLSP